MGGQGNVQTVIDVEPFGVMIHLLGDPGDRAHKSECSIEIGEFVAAPYRVPVSNRRQPARTPLPAPVPRWLVYLPWHPLCLSLATLAEKTRHGYSESMKHLLKPPSVDDIGTLARDAFRTISKSCASTQAT